MKKTILFFLFLIFCVANGYSSETILKYKYNKKEKIKTPIEFLKITKNEYDNKHYYDIKYKLKGQIPNYSEILVNEKFPIELPFSRTVDINIKEDGTFLYKGHYFSIEDKDYKYYDENIVFTFNFGIYDTDTYIERIIETLWNNDEVTVLNPVKISFQYNEQKKSFNITHTVFYINENGELKIKNIEVQDCTSDTNYVKKETLYTKYYIKKREISAEMTKKGVEEQIKQVEERKNRLLTIAKQMKKGINVVSSQKYSVEEIYAAYDKYLSGELYWMNATIVQIISDSELLVCILGTNSYYYLKFAKNFKADYFRAGQTYKFFYKHRAGDDTYSYRAINGNKNTVKKYYLYGAFYMNVIF